jgi:Flp pilus assembly protein TadB
MRVLHRSITKLRDLQDLQDLAALIQRQRAPSASIHMEVVAQWCEALAARIRAGETLARAVAETPYGVGLAAHLGPLRLRVQRGMDLVTACSTMIDGVTDSNSHDVPSYWRETLGVIRVCALGAPETAKTLDKMARNLRIRAAVTQETRSQTAAARLSAGLLTALPAVAVVVTVAISPASAQVFTTAIGLICLASSLMLNATGWVWIRSLLRSVER